MNYLFNEIQRRKLTEFLCECWHDPYWHDMRGTVCIKCDEPVSLSHDRTFDTWDDLGALKEKMVEKKEYGRFYLFAEFRYGESETIIENSTSGEVFNADITDWLL